MQKEKKELIKKLIIMNIDEIKEESKNLNCDFVKLCDDGLIDEANLDELLTLILDTKATANKFRRKIGSIRYSHELEKKIKPI